MKKFYTEKDIEDLFTSGTRSLRVDDEIALTDLAYEKAKQLGLQLLFDNVDVPSPSSAPIRPYLSDVLIKAATPVSTPSAKQQLRATPKVDSVAPSLSQTEKGSDVAQRIHSAVLARLGNQVDAKLLDVIIQRVLKSTGVK